MYNKTMQYLEYVMAFLAGGSVSVMLGVVFSLKINGLAKLSLNLLVGAVALFVLGAFGIPYFSLNAFNSFIVGVFGAPGLAVIFALAVFL